MNILAFDIVSMQGSFALLQDCKFLVSEKLEEQTLNSQTLLMKIQSALKKHNMLWQDLDVIATLSGPGSFTGIRVGLTMMKAFRYTLSCTLIVLSKFQFYDYYDKFFFSLKGILHICCSNFGNQVFYQKIDRKNKKLIPPIIIQKKKILSYVSPNERLICEFGEGYGDVETLDENFSIAKNLGYIVYKEKLNNKDCYKKISPLYIRPQYYK